MKLNNLSYKWLKALILLLAEVLPLAAYGQMCDTLRVSFRSSKSVYEPHYKDNALHVDRFIEAVKQQAQHTPPQPDTVDGLYRRIARRFLST